MLFFPLGQTDGEFDSPFAEVQVDRHQGKARAFHLADQTIDFRLVQQQFAGAHRIGFNMAGGGNQRRDMSAEQEYFAILDHYIGFANLRPTGTDGLDFPTFKYQSRLVTIFNEVIVEGFFVVGNAHGGYGVRPGPTGNRWGARIVPF